MVDLVKFAEENNIAIGACSPEPLCEKRLRASPFVPFVKKDLKKRVDPAAVLPGVRSIIAIGVGSRMPLISAFEGEIGAKAGYAELSSLGTDCDYHPIVKEVLAELSWILEKSFGSDFKAKALVDSPTLDERAFAHRAGLGFYGKNGLIICPKFGTRFNIGLLLTNFRLEDLRYRETQTFESCPPSCGLCIKACPNGALQEGQPLDAALCVSYLTQKKVLEPSEESLMGNQLYGCDICQDICPFNPPREKTYVNPQELAAWTDGEINDRFSHTSMLWQGTGILRRNGRLYCSI